MKPIPFGLLPMMERTERMSPRLKLADAMFLKIDGDGGRSIGGQDVDIENSRVAGGEMIYARTLSGSWGFVQCL